MDLLELNKARLCFHSIMYCHWSCALAVGKSTSVCVPERKEGARVSERGRDRSRVCVCVFVLSCGVRTTQCRMQRSCLPNDALCQDVHLDVKEIALRALVSESIRRELGLLAFSPSCLGPHTTRSNALARLG